MCDKTGFPLICIPQTGVVAHLLPVTKVQFEQFRAETGAYDDAWYRTLCELNPSADCGSFTEETREGLFLTGIVPEEAEAFARWMGLGLQLPTVEEWRAVYNAVSLYPCFPGCFPKRLCEPAGRLLERLQVQLQPLALLDLSLMNGGVVEWAQNGREWVGLGSPRPHFLPNLFNPLEDEIRPVRPGERLKYYGFRLIRRMG
ncbi:MAG: SUMF1/EgtB/PvdO family nonheme iron enzyme [Armatimonadetes bacterium]|nr:SUMF1/EgtB/PvdO family nonheme iron enzyme [Armatimonadota bacterium]